MILLKQNVGLFMKIKNEGVNMKCYNCGSTNTYVKDYKNDFTIKGKDISFISKRRFCHDCGKIVYDECLDNRTSELAIPGRKKSWRCRTSLRSRRIPMIGSFGKVFEKCSMTSLPSPITADI